ncbi:hypothetical protein HYR54_02460 [Candidatus Acetothermia bacterium]|nr:hypothetical protein [Candidatus Acetothermia bacterium]
MKNSRQLLAWGSLVCFLSLCLFFVGPLGQMTSYGQFGCLLSPKIFVAQKVPSLGGMQFELFDDETQDFNIRDIFGRLQAAPALISIPLRRIRLSTGEVIVDKQDVLLSPKELRASGFRALRRSVSTPTGIEETLPPSATYQGFVPDQYLAELYVPQRASGGPQGFISGFVLTLDGWFFIEPVRSLLLLNGASLAEIEQCGFPAHKRTHIVYKASATDFDIVLDPRCEPHIPGPCKDVDKLYSGVAINIDLPIRMIPGALPVRAMVTNNRKDMKDVDAVITLIIRRIGDSGESKPVLECQPNPSRVLIKLDAMIAINCPTVEFGLGSYVAEVRLTNPEKPQETFERQVKGIRVQNAVTIEEVLDRNNNNRLDDDELRIAEDSFNKKTPLLGFGEQFVSSQKLAELRGKFCSSSAIACPLPLRGPTGFANAFTLTVVGDQPFNQIQDEKEWWQRQEEVANLVDSLFAFGGNDFPRMNLRLQALETWQDGGPGSTIPTSGEQNATAVALLCDLVDPGKFPHTDQQSGSVTGIVHLMSGRNFAPMEKTDFGGNATDFAAMVDRKKGIIGLAENIGGVGVRTDNRHITCLNPQNPGVGIIFNPPAHHSISQHVPWRRPGETTANTAGGDTRNYNALLYQRFLLMAHELGHNLNAPHTLIPPEDRIEDRACNLLLDCTFGEPPGRTVMSPKINQDIVFRFFDSVLLEIGTRADNNSRLRECAAGVTCPAP